MADVQVDGSRTDVAFWDDQWTNRAKSSGIANRLREADFGEGGTFIKTMDRHAPVIFNGAKVVELGGASSRFAIDLAKFAGANVTIVDNSEVGIQQSRRMFAEEQVSIETVMADIFDMPEMAGQFDVVTHWGLMEHFDDSTLIFDISAKLLKPGGHLVYSMPNMAAAGASLWKRHAPANYAAHIFHTDDALQAAAASCGFGPQKQFHFGVPLVRMAPAERSKLTAAAADVVHAGLLVAGTLSPDLYTSGTARFASNRGFVLQKSA